MEQAAAWFCRRGVCDSKHLGERSAQLVSAKGGPPAPMCCTTTRRDDYQAFHSCQHIWPGGWQPGGTGKLVIRTLPGTTICTEQCTADWDCERIP